MYYEMEVSRRLKLLLHLCISISLQMIPFPPYQAAAAAGGYQTGIRPEQPCIATCLADHSIANFTLLPHHKNVDSPLYYNLLDSSIQNLRYAQSSVPKPAAIVVPSSKKQLVQTLLCSRRCSLEIRVRCGGHSYEGTSSVATDGSVFVIIDLMNLDRVSVDLESQTAWVEGGATLGQTYYAISEASKVLGFPAGSCSTVGTGGHFSGGGFGLLSRKYGVAADNVVDALLVDANGRVLDRGAMGEEVFWAIRGGGGGVWGIVYAWKIKLVEVPQVVTGFQVSRPATRSHAARLVNQWQKVAPMLEMDFYLSCTLSAGSPGSKKPQISTAFTGFYLGPKQEALIIMGKVFPELRLKEDECKEMNWIESIVYFSSSSSVSALKDRFAQRRSFYKAKSDYVKAIIPKTGVVTALTMLEKQPKGYVIFDPYGGIMDNISSESIAFPHRKGNLFCIQYMVDWQEADKARGKEYIDWIRGFYKAMTPYVSESPRAAYINYMDLDLGKFDDSVLPWNAVERARAWGEKYFLSNYDRLVKAKTLIDPHNIFRHQQGIPPLPISKAMPPL